MLNIKYVKYQQKTKQRENAIQIMMLAKFRYIPMYIRHHGITEKLAKRPRAKEHTDGSRLVSSVSSVYNYASPMILLTSSQSM